MAFMSPRRKSGGGRRRGGELPCGPFVDPTDDDFSCDGRAENRWAAGVILLRLATGLSECELEQVSTDSELLHEVSVYTTASLRIRVAHPYGFHFV